MSQKPTNQSDGIERGGQFLVYEAEDGKLKIDVRLEDETLWLPQAQLAELFQTSQQNVSLHIQHIYEEGELPPEATHKKYLLVRSEGGREVKRLVDHYNLSLIHLQMFIRDSPGTYAQNQGICLRTSSARNRWRHGSALLPCLACQCRGLFFSAAHD